MKFLVGLFGEDKVKQYGLFSAIFIGLTICIGLIILHFGPILLDNYLKKDDNHQIEKKAELELALMEKMDNMIDKLKNSNIPIEQNSTKTPKINPKVPEIPKIVPAVKINEDKTEQISKKEIANKNTAEAKKDIQVVSVLEDQEFKLCGYDQFTAKIIKIDVDPSIKIHSMDRSIPNRPFRGYEKIVPIQKMVEIFPGCNAMFKFENLLGNRQIMISYSRR